MIPLVLAGLSTLGPFSIDAPFPAFPQMGADFGVDAAQMQLVVSAYLFAFGAMSVFHGPISDALGRKPVMLAGVTAYGIASLAAAFAPNLAVLLLCRVAQGISAGGGVIVSRTIIRDLFEGAEAQRLMSRVAMIFGLAPAIAPVVGGALLQIGRWPVIFVFQAGIALALISAVTLLLPETHPASRRTSLSIGGVLQPLGRVARDLAYQRLAWAALLAQASWFIYIGGAAIYVAGLLGRGESDYWVLFFPMVAGVILGSWVSGRTAGRVGGRAIISIGFGITALGALLGVALASLPGAATVPSAIIAPSVMTFGACVAYPTTQLSLLDLFPANRGAAASLGACQGLIFNASVTAWLVPSLAGAVRDFAIAAVVLCAGCLALWTWHLLAARRPLPTPEHTETLEPEF